MHAKLALMGGPKAVTLAAPPYPVIDHEEITGVVRTLMTGQLSQVGHGGVVGEFEDACAEYFGVKWCHSFNSGTAAIASALFALGVRPGDEVLTASNTWISGINAICHAGALPVFCDVAPGEQYIDPEEIRRKAGPHTRAVIVTHLWGMPADMDPIMQAARDKHLHVVEDCSHAHGGKYKGRLLGTIGDIGAFSLQGSKAIVAGEGGFLLTNEELGYQRAMVPGDHGVRLRQELTDAQLACFSRGGGAWTYRMAPVCAAIALAQLRKLDRLNAARQANFDRLHARLQREAPFIEFPVLHEGSIRGWYSTPATFALEHPGVGRDLFVEACQAEGANVRGVGYDNFYEIPLYQDPAVFSQLWPAEHPGAAKLRTPPPGSLKNNEALRTRQLLLPIFATECSQLMDQIADAIAKVAGQLDALAAHGSPARDPQLVETRRCRPMAGRPAWRRWTSHPRRDWKCAATGLMKNGLGPTCSTRSRPGPCG